MGRKRKPSIDMRKEKHPFVIPRARFNLTWARKAATIARDQPLVLVTPDVVRRNHGEQPFPRRHDAKKIHGEEACRHKNAQKIAGESRSPRSGRSPAEESKGQRLD